MPVNRIQIPSVDAAALYQKILNSGTLLHLRADGRSMAPILNSGDMVTIRKTWPQSLRQGDLILFKTPVGQLLLHRIIYIRQLSDGIVLQTKGDAAYHRDFPISSNAVLGKVCKIEKSVPFWGFTSIDMESVFWKGISYLIAIVFLLNPSIRYPIFCCYRGLKLILRP